MHTAEGSRKRGRRGHGPCLPCLILLAYGSVAGGAAEREPARDEPALRVARSDDGLTFRETGEVVALRASAPGLLKLPNGQILAVFDDQRHSTGNPALAVVRSSDNGRTWSEPQPIRLTSTRPLLVRCVHGELLALPDGTIRLYFIIGGGTRPNRGVRGPGPMLVGAVGRDGANFRMDEEIRIPLEPAVDPHLALLDDRGEIHLFVSDDGTTEGNRHWIGTDARRFEASPAPSEPLPAFRCVVRTERGLRGYFRGEEGMLSMTSPDGRNWTREQGVRLAGQWDPAVVRLDDGSFLMVYASVPDPASLTRSGPEAANPAEAPGDDEKAELELRAKSLTQVFRLGLPCLVYAEKHNGAMPPDLQTLVEEGSVKPSGLVSPLAGDRSEISYVYIQGQNHNMDPRNIVAYERPENHGNLGTVALFLDGHAQWMYAEDFETALQETMDRLGR